MKKYLERGYAVDCDRLVKARKIELVLLDYLQSTEDHLSGKSIVDIGCGSGRIAAYFSQYNKVLAADVVDQISPDIKGKINFVKIENNLSSLPTGDFDVVIMNQVFAHVKEKLIFLTAVNRVLKDNGVCYIANPNRYFPVEPYYKIPLLHYLPDKLFLKLAKYLGKNQEDVYLVSHLSLKKIACLARFTVNDYTIEVINNPGHYANEYKIPLGMRLPELASIFSPTNIYILKKSG